MNKKIAITALILFLLVGISAVGIHFRVILTTVGNGFWSFLANQLEREEEVAEHSIYGRVGRDTVFVLGDGKFQIGKFGDVTALVMYYEDDLLLETLLSDVKAYRKKNNKLYVISSEGYGVVDGNSNTCKLVITAKKQKITKYNDAEENRRITYIESYDLLEDGEKKIFETMK